MNKTRVCNKCKIGKPLSEFHKCKSSPLGHLYTCKECRKHIDAERYPKRKLKYRILHPLVDKESITHKVCKKCGVDKPIEDFIKDSRLIGGRGARCKECCKYIPVFPRVKRVVSEETKKKISIGHLGIEPWNKGKKLSDEHKGKILVHILSRGPISETTRQKLSDGHKGEKSAFFGKHLPESTRKKISETKVGDKNPMFGKCGDLAPNWQGGKSFEPYCVKFNREFKERVRAFFDYTCVECGAHQNGKSLHVHHVNFKKDACCNETVIPLFVSLCDVCHGKSGHNREYWEKHFTEIIEKDYGGKCYFTKEEMKNNG